MFDIRIYDLDFTRPYYNKLKHGKVGEKEVDSQYGWFIVTKTDEQTKVIRKENQTKTKTKRKCKRKVKMEMNQKSQNEDKNANENGTEYEDECVDENDKDPQYCLFLENLTEHGKSYKLKISEKDEEPRFLYYEAQDNSDWCDELQTCIDNFGVELTLSEDLQINQKAKRRLNGKNMKISTRKGVFRRKKIDDQKSLIQHYRDMIPDRSYKLKISQNEGEPRLVYFEELQTCIDDSGNKLSEDLQINQKAKRRLNEKKVAFSTKEEVSRRKKMNDQKSITQSLQGMIVDPCYQTFVNSFVPSEKNVTAFDSDLDVVILDDFQLSSKVNNEQPTFGQNEPSLREKLMHMLKQPYDERENEYLSDIIQQKKPMGRHLDLRGRPVSSDFGGVEKSLLDKIPGSFRMMLSAAQNDPPKALNLLRMCYFWLQHLPNEDVSEPWKDKLILKVRPGEKTI